MAASEFSPDAKRLKETDIRQQVVSLEIILDNGQQVWRPCCKTSRNIKQNKNVRGSPWWLLGFVCLLTVMAIGRGTSGGLSLGGRLQGSSRSKSPGMGSSWSGDLSSRVHFSGGSVMKTKEWPCTCKEILRLTKTTTTTGGTRDVCLPKARKIIRIKEVSL